MARIRDLSNLSDDEFSRTLFESLGAKGKPVPKETRLQEGQTVAGTIVGVTRDDVFVELGGGKSQGVIARNEFPLSKKLEIGSPIEAIVLRFEPDQALYVLSLGRAPARVAWDELREGMIIEGRVTGTNKGGLDVEVSGVRGFLPASQVELHRVEDFEPYVGTRIRCEVTQLDREARNLVLSRRTILEREAKERKQELLNALVEGEVRPGVIRKAMTFGLFVDIGGVDGLLHVSEIRQAGASEGDEDLAPGKTVDVRILAIDRASERISLGLVRREPDRWLDAATQFAPGEKTKGWVSRFESGGVWIALGEGVEGFLPRAEIGGRVKDPRDVLTEGAVVDVTVKSVDIAGRRIGLSMRTPGDDPWYGIEERYPQGSVIQGKVKHLAAFGAFVEIEPGVEGLIHISELSEGRVEHVSDVVQPGDVVRLRVLRVEPERRRLALSLRDVPRETA
ncbi:MAG: 30S ribosomal protein S1 [Planctomycetes bacterium]|nr:30S ribosomal protein S1 [Planctomycetota bacterium]